MTRAFFILLLAAVAAESTWAASLETTQGSLSGEFEGVSQSGLDGLAPLSWPTRVVTNAADSGPGTLRQALADAKHHLGPDRIEFNIPGPGPHEILLLQDLETIRGTVVIDGTTQPGYAGTPLIVLRRLAAPGSGVAAPAAEELQTDAGRQKSYPAGIHVRAWGTIIRGLAIGGFANGIWLDNPGQATVEACFIGTDPSGLQADPNSENGIAISSSGNTIGGTNAGAGNVISANGGHGLLLVGDAKDNAILHNRIGTSADGSAVLGNGGDGIRLISAKLGFLGADPIRNQIRGNSIFGNGGLGIDLGGDGPTANDAGDWDHGVNRLKNFPVLTQAATLGSTVFLAGQFNSIHAPLEYTLEFFSSPQPDPSGHGEGRHFIGETQVVTTASGDASFLLKLELPAGSPRWITATATDFANNTSEFSPALLATPGTPPVVTVPPASTNVPPGGTVILCVTVTGPLPLAYQWRRNGVNIPGANGPCFIIPEAQARDGGGYDVVVSNPFGAALSARAAVVINVPVLPPGDNLADRVPLPMSSNTVRGFNLNATREPGEPRHVGKPGGASVWYSFTSDVAGVMSIDMAGSTFDTLLAVYTGTTIPELAEVTGDEESGGSLTSQTRFNVTPGVEYVIAVDGHGATMGDFVFSWEFTPTTEMYAVILIQPESITVPPGADHTFTVTATGTGLGYQWFFNGVPVPDATTDSLTISNVQESVLGTYMVRLTQGIRSLDSRPVSLQINLTGPATQPVQATDKFLDADVLSNPILLGPEPEDEGDAFAPASVVRGYTGTQVFNTFGAVSTPGETPVCGVPGGASTWLKLVAEQSGELHINTDGSSFNTVLEVYERIVGVTNLNFLGCDDTNGLDRLDSALVVPVVGGRTNFIVIDGVNAAMGVLRFNYNLVVPSTLTALGRNGSGQFQFLVTGKPGMVFRVLSTADLTTWTTLFTGTNAAGSYIYTDTNSPVPGNRLYRLQMLP